MEEKRKAELQSWRELLPRWPLNTNWSPLKICTILYCSLPGAEKCDKAKRVCKRKWEWEWCEVKLSELLVYHSKHLGGAKESNDVFLFPLAESHDRVELSIKLIRASCILITQLDVVLKDGLGGSLYMTHLKCLFFYSDGLSLSQVNSSLHFLAILCNVWLFPKYCALKSSNML